MIAVSQLRAGRRLGVLAALAALALDQASKQVVLGVFDRLYDRIEVTGFFNLTLVYNRGVSFGLFAGDSVLMQWGFVALALAVAGFLARWLWRGEGRLSSIALGLIIGGAVGNAIDRIWLGAVVDFLDFHVGGYHWPAFNIADSAIAIGVAGLVIDGFIKPNGDNESSTGDKSA